MFNRWLVDILVMGAIQELDPTMDTPWWDLFLFKWAFLEWLELLFWKRKQSSRLVALWVLISEWFQAHNAPGSLHGGPADHWHVFPVLVQKDKNLQLLYSQTFIYETAPCKGKAPTFLLFSYLHPLHSFQRDGWFPSWSSCSCRRWRSNVDQNTRKDAQKVLLWR